VKKSEIEKRVEMLEKITELQDKIIELQEEISMLRKALDKPVKDVYIKPDKAKDIYPYPYKWYPNVYPDIYEAPDTTSMS